MTLTRYNAALNNFGDLIAAAKTVFLGQNTEVIGEITRDDEIAFWINNAYHLLENYDWNWSRKKDSTGLVTASGTSAYTLPLVFRDKKPIDAIYVPGNTAPALNEVVSFEEYKTRIAQRTSQNYGEPREFCYTPRLDSTISYSTGTISAGTGAYLFTGIGTQFLNKLFSGSTVTIGSDVYTVATVISDTQFYVTSATTSTYSSASYTATTNYPLAQIDLNPVPSAVQTYDIYFYKRFIPMMGNSDVPLLPINDRWVLVHGAYSLYQWFHGQTGVTGISPDATTLDRRQFLQSPTTMQKFFNQYVSKLLAEDKKQGGSQRPKMVFKRGYRNA